MKTRLLRVLPPSIIQPLREYRAIRFGLYANDSFSQEGEDLILRRVFRDRTNGFYVDVGAHHPVRFSNTYLFYKLGWRGVNIDAMPGSMTLFDKWRPRDINIEVAISEHQQEMTYYIFNERALNSFDPDLSSERSQGPYKVVEKRRIRTQRLEDILRNAIPEGQSIDFLTVDVEGLDLDVLKSNDWEIYRPAYVLAECWGVTLEGLEANPIYRFLADHGYQFFAKTVATMFFKFSQVD